MQHEGEMIDSEGTRKMTLTNDNDSHKVSVIIRDISFHCTEEDLYALFGTFANSIRRLTVRRSDEDGRSLLHAFADCKERDGAAALIHHFNNHRFMGRVMKLEFCNPNQTKPEKPKLNAFQVHIDYISYYKNHIQERVTEEILERDCSAFGEIVDVVIKNHTETLHNENRNILFQKGFGFIYFKDFIAAQIAVNSPQLFIQAGKVICRLSFSHKTRKSFAPNHQPIPPDTQVFYHPQGYQFQHIESHQSFSSLHYSQSISYPTMPPPIQIASPGFPPSFSSDSFSPNFHLSNVSPYHNTPQSYHHVDQNHIQSNPFLDHSNVQTAPPHMQINQLQLQLQLQLQQHYQYPVSYPSQMVPRHSSPTPTFPYPLTALDNSALPENSLPSTNSSVRNISSVSHHARSAGKSKLRGPSKKHHDHMRNL